MVLDGMLFPWQQKDRPFIVERTFGKGSCKSLPRAVDVSVYCVKKPRATGISLL